MPESNSNRSKRNRSPSYPLFDLEKAVERAKNFYQSEGFNEAIIDVAVQSWGLTPGGSAGYRNVAALLHYGLFEDEGSGEERKIYLSELGKAIVVDEREDSPERDQAIKQAALNPNIFRQLWDKWKSGLPSDANIKYYLVRDLGFNRKHVNKFIENFRSTIDYAGLIEGEVKDADSQIENDSMVVEKTSEEKRERSQFSFKSSGFKNDGRFLDIPVPLISGNQATLRLPIPLTETDFQLVKNSLNTYLESMKPAIIQDERPEKNEEEEGGTARSH